MLTVRIPINDKIIFAWRSNYPTSNHHFLLRLLFDLDIRALIFPLTTNLEAGPCFAKIWLVPILRTRSTLKD